MPITDAYEIRSFSAKSWQDALRQVRNAMGPDDRSEVAFRLFTQLVEQRVPVDLVRTWIDRTVASLRNEPSATTALLATRVGRLIEEAVVTTSGIQRVPGHEARVALVGPGRSGKSSAILKLAVEYHLRRKWRVGLIAMVTGHGPHNMAMQRQVDLIDLPFEPVAIELETEQALDRFRGFDLILMDTPGLDRSDAVNPSLMNTKQALRAFRPTEVHLVLRAGSSWTDGDGAATTLADHGPDRMIVTHMDQAHPLGSVLALPCKGPLALSYLMGGPCATDWMEVAKAVDVADRILPCCEKFPPISTIDSTVDVGWPIPGRAAGASCAVKL